ncbi:MAG: hypothetical protein PVH91_00135 [Pseudomonadales bacterium]|jgi:hypothetical protein
MSSQIERDALDFEAEPTDEDLEALLESDEIPREAFYLACKQALSHLNSADSTSTYA